MTKLFQILFFLHLSVSAFSQSDSLNLVRAGWNSNKLSEGVVWKTAHFGRQELFNSNQHLNIIEIAPRSVAARLVVAYSDSLQKTSDIALSRKALAGINGSFFKMRGADPDHHPELKSVPKAAPSKAEKNRSVVYLRVNDSLISGHVFSRDSVRKRHQQGVIAIKGGRVSILTADPSTLLWESRLDAEDVISTGPVMLLSGLDQPIPDDAFCNDRHPRTAVGKKSDGTVVLFAVDGRFADAAGMSIKELQKTLRWLGCTEAINLDGGGSTTMYIKGQPFNGVVNHPSDNKRFDHKGERDVANVLLLLPIN